jgi:uncharacterized protein DUF6675
VRKVRRNNARLSERVERPNPLAEPSSAARRHVFILAVACSRSQVNGSGTIKSATKLFVFLLTALLAETAAASEGPRPPCGNSPLPSYPMTAGPPVVQSETVTNWAQPACLGWDGPAPKLIVAIAGRLRESGGAAALLARFGAVSRLRGVRYWSVTDRAWRTLITDAFAVEDVAGRRRRDDFPANEMILRNTLYMSERDSRSSGPVIYRMRVLSSTRERVVVSVSNASPVRASMITLFARGELQTTYFLEQLGPNDWGYYGISGVATGLLTGGIASSVNRAVAYYRYFVGIPTDAEPPAAR